MTFLDPVSNGEYDPPRPSPVVRETRRRLAAMDRRTFLSSLCGTAAVLLALNACTRESGGGDGGGFTIPPESTTEPEAAAEVLSGEEFVFDVQTHLLEGSGAFGRGFPQAGCAEGDCFSIEHWLEAVFVRSDTSLAVLSAIPAASPFDGPLSIAVMEEARRVAEAAECDDRVLLHGQAVPTMPGFVEAMQRVAGEHPVAAWKAYTHTPRHWRLDDALGDTFFRTAVELDTPVVCVHKGFGADPADVGPAAARHRDVQLVAYHSGYEPGQPDAVDRLLRTMKANGIGPNENVWAELGSTWFNLMRAPDDAAHVLGKLLRDVGEDRVLWGTDSIWYGSPQDQLRAFRAFEISEEYQERFGYPALTPEVKRKVLGLNAARLYGVDPVARPRCEGTLADLERLRDELPPMSAHGPRTPSEAAAVRASDWAWNV